MPYILHGDAVNMKSNQKNLGYIRCANLCLEVCEFSSEDETPSCNLSSISLRAFVRKEFDFSKMSSIAEIQKELTRCYDFNKLGRISARLVDNLNQVIDRNTYFIETIKNSNMRHRPIGIGVSGYAEMLHQLDLPFQDKDYPNQPHSVVRMLNKMIFSCIYWNSLVASMELAIKDGKYSTFDGSPLSEGKFQFDLWKEEYQMISDRIDSQIRKEEDDDEIEPSTWGQVPCAIDVDSNGVGVLGPTWSGLRKMIQLFGVRNSLLIAIMPTATSSQPLRNGETVEAHQSNIYSRKVLKGAYPVVNRYMVWDLKKIGLWNKEIIGLIQANAGSISILPKYIRDNLEKFPDFDQWKRLDHICQKYRTMWELSTKIFLQLAADRGRYVCQSQSTNVYSDDPSDIQLMAIHNYAQHLGLKTGMYYLRQRAAVDPIKITIDPDLVKYVNENKYLDIDHSSDESEEEFIDLTSSSSSISSNSRLKTGRSLKREIECTDEVCISCQ